ncbi:MAG: S8 family serine peptidase [Armatimonadetes bacterium]|nr:S8 family serine peptidase [Armatimonadota bacterium]
METNKNISNIPKVILQPQENIKPNSNDETLYRDFDNEILGVEEFHNQGITGKNINIAVIGTGVIPHPDIKDNILYFKDFVYNKKEPYDYDVSSAGNRYHETRVCGIIAGTGKLSKGKIKGIAPGAKLICLKVMDEKGNMETENILKALSWIIENKDKYNIKILNYSLTSNGENPSADRRLNQAMEKAAQEGIICVVSAGNNGTGTKRMHSPAYLPSVITVGASNHSRSIEMEDDRILLFSSYDYDFPDKPDISAPGKDLATINGDYFNSLDKLPPSYAYTNMTTGTSFAAPVIAGAIALMLDVNPSLTKDQISEALKKTAFKLPDYHGEQGAGVVNFKEAMNYIFKNYKNP